MKSPLLSIVSLPVILVAAALLWIVLAPDYPWLQQLDLWLYTIGAPENAAQIPSTLPWWYGIASGLSWTVAILLWVFILPRLSLGTGLAIALFFNLLLLASQLAAFQLYHWRVSQGLLIQFLLATTPWVLLYAYCRRRWQALLTQRDTALLELAEIKLQAGKLDQTEAHLKICQPTLEVTELGYRLALQQEQRRSYQAATRTYQWLASINPNYKDVSEKANSTLSATAAINSNDYLATQTLNLSEDELRQPHLGRYRIEAELGRGAMGTVYIGVDPKIARRVAIKTLSFKMFQPSELDEVKQRFFREAEAAGRLSHPNIVTVFDVGEEPDLCFIAMDYIQGHSLRDNTTPENLLDVELVYQLMAQVAEALDYAHQQNIVHRDIKPGNLLLDTQQQQIKVADFGIARIVDDSSTKTGDILGSPLYMSPEQLKGQKVTGATDIYSLGVTLYQLLTGQAPYSGDSIANLAYQVINKKYKSVREWRPELPASAPRIVNKALAKEPDKRFATAGEMAEALRKALKKDFGITA